MDVVVPFDGPLAYFLEGTCPQSTPHIPYLNPHGRGVEAVLGLGGLT